MRTNDHDRSNISNANPRPASLPQWVIEMHIGRGLSHLLPQESTRQPVNADLRLAAAVALVGLLAALLAAILFPDLAALMSGASSS